MAAVGGLLLAKSGLAGRGPDLACTDVAAATGLDFRGEYGTVVSVPDALGTLMQRNMGNGAAVGDYNGDGWLDVLLLGQAGHASRLFRNDPGPAGGRRFTDVTAQAGLGSVTSSARVAQFVDLAGSGRPDLVIAADHVPGDAAVGSQVFRNNGDGTFTDVTAGSGFDPEGYIVGGMALADFDGRGLPSIYLSYWTEELGGSPARDIIQGTWPGQNRLYRNLGGYRFEDVTDSAGIGHYHADSFTAVFAPFTSDGRPDIYQANDHRPDRFYRNLGDGRFADVSTEVGLTRKGNSMGVAPALRADGMLNLYVTNITDQDGYFGTNIGNTFMVSAADGSAPGITFRNEASSAGILDTAWGWGASFVDLNGDGAQDIYAVQGMRAFVGADSRLYNATSKLFLNDGTDRRFTESAAPGCELPGDQRALVVFDYNRDGAPDLLITQVNAPVVLLENRLSGRHWLTVAPTGTGDAGIDARVTVTAAGRTMRQIVLAGGSYLAGPPREAYFGLDTATMVDSVRVDWLGGGSTELRNVRADQVLTVQAPRS